jgi:hypothetical protein
MRSIFVLLLLATVTMAFPTSSLYQRHTDGCPYEPLHKHCCDVTVNTSDSKASEWLSANEYRYTNWTQGLCDQSVYPTLESSTHPGVTDQVTERKFGHGAALSMAMAGDFGNKSVDCRSDKTSEEETIAITNGAGVAAKIRGCQDQYTCKPYRDCDVAMPAGSTEAVVFDASFKYFVFVLHGGGSAELYPDANMKYPKEYTIKKQPDYSLTRLSMAVGDEPVLVLNSPSPGSHAHCTELSFLGGSNNAYYQSHGYQYDTWGKGPCSAQYNWFNRNTTIAPGVTQTELGVHTSVH